MKKENEYRIIKNCNGSIKYKNNINKMYNKIIQEKIFLLIFIVIFFNLIINYGNNLILIEKNLNKEFKDMKKFVSFSLNGILINKNEVFHKVKNPKISIIIAAFNAEGYIQKSLLSIQNQNFKDIEIIIVDDNSKDNTTALIKELMKKDERIELYINEINKGTLYTKCRGVSNSKGKYVMILDQDDLYTQKDVFSTLYAYLENKHLDMIGFASIFSNDNIPQIIQKTNNIIHYFESPILYQPDISSRMYNFSSNDIPTRVNYVIWDYIFKGEIFRKVVKLIHNKFMNTKMICHEDFLLFFLLSRASGSLKYIKRIFYVNIQWVNDKKYKNKINKELNDIDKDDLICLSYINFIEFLLINTNNNIKDKRIASLEYNNYYLNHECRNNKFILERAINVSKLFLENEYIEISEKNNIMNFLNGAKTI